jgi:hypothetical protein
MSRPSPAALEWGVLTLLGLVAAAFLIHEARGTTFWFDEWDWVTERRGNDPATFLRPHNEHLSLIPVALYKLLFSTSGLEHYEPFRLMTVVGHLACSLLLFAYARARVGAIPGLCAVTLLVFFGAAWQNVLWPFQVAWLIALAAALAAFLMLDRADRRGDVTASALLAIGLASSGLMLAVCIGLLVEILLGRRAWRRSWIVLAPLGAYAVWWLAYRPGGLVRQNLDLTPAFVLDTAASALSGLFGLAGQGSGFDADPLAWGRPLLVVAVAALVWRLRSLGPVTPRVAGLIAILLAFWTLTGLGRAGLGNADASRYLYVSGLFMLLLALELARGVVLTRSAAVMLVIVTAAAALSGAGALRDAGRELRKQAEVTRASLGALELARESVNPQHVAQGVPGYPLVHIVAGRYFAAVDADGSPAAEPEEIARSTEPARLAADNELVLVREVALRAAQAGASNEVLPAPARAEAVAVTEVDGCQRVQPSTVVQPGTTPSVELTLPAQGLHLSTVDGPAKVAVRRFADGFTGPVRDTVATSAQASLRIPADDYPGPWRVRVAPQGSVTICALG